MATFALVSRRRSLFGVIGLAAALVIAALPTTAAQRATILEHRPETSDHSTANPLFIRIFKQELQLELWMQTAERFELLDSFPICHWSGTRGPKLYEGDRQAPEGFYSVGLQQLDLDRPSRPFARSRLSERRRSFAGTYRITHPAAWRLPLDRLFRHDRRYSWSASTPLPSMRYVRTSRKFLCTSFHFV